MQKTSNHHIQTAEQLYRQYSEMVRTYLMRFVSEADARDLTQEVFVKVTNNIGQFRGDSSVKTWVYRIASNTMKDFLKSKVYRASTKQLPISEAELEGCDSSLKFGPLIEAKLDASAMNRCIQEYIHRLPINYSTVMVLRELEELSANEVSKILNLPIGTVKMRLLRARAKLKTELEEGCIISTDGDGKPACERKY